MSHQDDVLIIGGGVIGLCCALALLEAGRGVRVLEAGKTGCGSSHGNCGTITPSHAPPLAAPGMITQAMRWMLTPDAPLYVKPSIDPALWAWLLQFAGRCNARDWRQGMQARSALLNDSRQRLSQWVRDYRLACAFDESGVDYVYRDRRRLEKDASQYAALRQFGIATEAFDAAAYAREEPALRDDISVGALRFAGDASLRPNDYVAELARVVRGQGGVIEEGCRVEAVSSEATGVAVSTSRGVRRGRDAVIALGAWSPSLAKSLHIKLPIQPGKGYSITYSRPRLAPRRPIVLKDVSVCVTTWEDGYRLGSTMEFSGYDSTLNRTRLDALERGARAYLREPVGPERREEWFGWRPMTYDDVPIIGRAPGHDHVWLATGHGMLGVSMSTGTGQLIADLITANAPSIDPTLYSAERFQ
ncbi:MAG: FAD-dependent oxidoreductase [Luteimonas sp.]